MTAKTIYALASGAGKAGIAVIRVSGLNAGTALKTITSEELPKARCAVVRTFSDPKEQNILDKGLAIWFPGPKSFTGEDVVEIHLHGGLAVIASVLQALNSFEGLRMAEPGEFTRRAFENNKLDLTAVEGLADLINAETEAQRCQALRQMRGELGQLYESWRRTLLAIIVNIEATIDFSDEELPDNLVAKAKDEASNLLTEMASHLKDYNRGEILRNGVHVAIIGPPNAGKSSFLNLLTRRNISIVSDRPGTTRDLIETRLDIGGYPVVIVDTAGLCEGRNKVEKEGIRRARERAVDADLKVAIFDMSKNPDSYTVEMLDNNSLVIANKLDIKTGEFPKDIGGLLARRISIKTGDGVEELMKALEQEIKSRCNLSSSPLLTQARHRSALEECYEALVRFSQVDATEIAAEELRLAVRALGRITGRVDVEDILDGVFQDFCIGK